MNGNLRRAIVVLVTLATSMSVFGHGQASKGTARPTGAQTKELLDQALPAMDGAHLSIEVVEVVYGPGQSSSPHSHPCPVIGVVTAGSLKMQVKGEPQHLYKAGDTFYEPPNGVHLVSANASSKMPAKFLAYFVCDHKTELSVPVGPN